MFITACLSMMLDIGFMFSFGTLYVDIMTTFNVSRSQAAMVQSILMAVRFGTGKKFIDMSSCEYKKIMNIIM